MISGIEKKNKDGNYLFAIIIGNRLENLLKRLLDEAINIRTNFPQAPATGSI